MNFSIIYITFIYGLDFLCMKSIRLFTHHLHALSLLKTCFVTALKWLFAKKQLHVHFFSISPLCFASTCYPNDNTLFTIGFCPVASTSWSLSCSPLPHFSYLTTLSMYISTSIIVLALIINQHLYCNIYRKRMRWSSLKL
jgi:hypothetical protein